MAKKKNSRSASSKKARRVPCHDSSRLHFRSSISCLQDLDPLPFDDGCSSGSEDLPSSPVSDGSKGASELHARVGANGLPKPNLSSADGFSGSASSVSIPALESSSSDSTSGTTFISSSISVDSPKVQSRLNVIPIPHCISTKGRNLWSFALVGYFLDGAKSLSFADFWAKRIWGSNVGKVFLNGNGLFIFKFSNENDLQLALSGPIFFGKSLLILHRWTSGLDLARAKHTSVPIWINFFNIPLDLWHEDGLKFLASQIGKPLRMDEHTLNGNKLSYAKICVDVDVSTTIPSSLLIQIEQCDPHVVEVIVPWKPHKCLHCNLYGHLDSNCKSYQRPNGTGNSCGKRKFEWRIKGSSAPISVSNHSSIGIASPPRTSNILQSYQTPESSARKRVHFLLPSDDDALHSDNDEPITSSDDEGSIHVVSDRCSVPQAGCGSSPLISFVGKLPSVSMEKSLCSPVNSGLALFPTNHADFLLDKVLNARKDAFSSFVSLKPCLKKSTIRFADPT